MVRGINPVDLVESDDRPAAGTADEALVSDVRGSLTPAQMVERKLVSLLKGTPLPMSRLQAGGVQRPRP